MGKRERVVICDDCPCLNDWKSDQMDNQVDNQIDSSLPLTCNLDKSHIVQEVKIGKNKKWVIFSTNCELREIRYGNRLFRLKRMNINQTVEAVLEDIEEGVKHVRAFIQNSFIRIFV